MFALLRMSKAISLHHTTDPFLMSMLVGSSLRRKMTLKNNNTSNWSTGAQITENMLNQSVPLCTSSDLWLFCLESSIML